MNWPKSLDIDLEMQNDYLKGILYEISVYFIRNIIKLCIIYVLQQLMAVFATLKT